MKTAEALVDDLLDELEKRRRRGCWGSGFDPHRPLHLLVAVANLTIPAAISLAFLAQFALAHAGRGSQRRNRGDDAGRCGRRKASDCTPDGCELIGEFYYKLAELQTIAERLQCPGPINLAGLVIAAYRAAEETKRIGGKDPF